MNPQYTRVIPRDLFNESKLLKCIGKLVLLIHDGYAVNNMTFSHDDEPFKIGLHDEGYLQITNVCFFVNGKRIDFVTTYNSKANYPLAAYHEYCEYRVFDEQGNYTDEFKTFCNSL